MSKISGIFRVIINRIHFSILRMTGHKVTVKGRCTSRLNNEFSISMNGKMTIGYHFSSLTNCRFLVRGGTLFIGNNVGLNSNCIIACHEKINIGDNVEIGPNVCIYDHDHNYRNLNINKNSKFICSPISIGKGTWIGANVVILRGATIGEKCVIGAGSVVIGNIPDNSVYLIKRNQVITSID